MCGIQTLAIAILYTSKGTETLNTKVYDDKHRHIFTMMNFALDSIYLFIFGFARRQECRTDMAAVVRYISSVVRAEGAV